MVQKSTSAGADEAVRAEIFAYLADRLGGFKQPATIDFIDEMPRDPSGKLFKRRLRDPYWDGQDRRI